MTIATASKAGDAWISPVFYAYDENYTFYWYSRKQTKHSQYIIQNKTIAVVIFNPSHTDISGVYMQGDVHEVTKKTIIHALTTYFARAEKDNITAQKEQREHPEDFLDGSDFRMYAFTPKKTYISCTKNKWHGKWLDEKCAVKL